MRKATSCMVVLLALIIAGCNIAPQQPGEAIAFGYMSHKALTRSATEAVRGGLISIDQAEQASMALKEALVQLQFADQAYEESQLDVAADATAKALGFLRVVESILSQAGDKP